MSANPADQPQEPFWKWGGSGDELPGAKFLAARFPGWEQFTRWEWLPEELKAMQTRIVYIGVDGSHWELYGPCAGREGVVLEKEFLGPMGVPFEHRWSEGPYTVGSTLERTDIRKRPMSFGVVINPNANIRARLNAPTETVYRNTEARWHRAWSKRVHGWLGFFTRSTGWRWLKVLLDGGSQETLGMDPTAFRNNMRQATMNVVAADPYMYKRAFVSRTTGFDPDQPKVPVQNQGSTHKPWDWLLNPNQPPTMVHTSQVRIVNRGQVSVWPRYIVSGTGRCWIQDGMTDTMVPCPELYESDGYMLVDTDPTARTFTTSKEPVDTAFYRFARQVEILDYFPALADLGEKGLPAWRRSNGARFQSSIPRETATTIRLYSDNPDAKVTALVPQKYETGW